MSVLAVRSSPLAVSFEEHTSALLTTCGVHVGWCSSLSFTLLGVLRRMGTPEMS
ncbi:hypothetical protein HYPSUDRAFT_200345 [Hypholoma sublateritium FD-334 SS-4]|uniref:Uncharacterized protein n=1 Tax=Hypholoma sublateritium (strain FD-334 SS-4) TaxID=945553 RepID=A0A0D2P834_HYPSF|nr:hypothetical protein HYPSUDRAFT_200345 [Hypholoma sublateritium FD-334 SS-4]